MAKGEETKQNACPGDCATCGVLQRNYCAASMSRNIQDMVFTLAQEVNKLQERLNTLMNGDIVQPPTANDTATTTSDAQ